MFTSKIEVGGIHVGNVTNPLPEDLRDFIDSAEHGVVFFSLGSNLKPSNMKDEKKRAIIGALTRLKQKIVWKWDDETLNPDESRFFIRKWLPQDDILAHPNVKLFVTHGGLLSTIEAISRGKPVVGIPIFGDQMVRKFFRVLIQFFHTNCFYFQSDEHGTNGAARLWHTNCVSRNDRRTFGRETESSSQRPKLRKKCCQNLQTI